MKVKRTDDLVIMSKPKKGAAMDIKTRRAITEDLAVSVELAARALGVGKYAAYVAIRDGDLPSIKVGRKIKVPTAALRKLLLLEDGSQAI
jgi:excisionase family DNA binding protein